MAKQNEPSKEDQEAVAQEIDRIRRLKFGEGEEAELLHYARERVVSVFDSPPEYWVVPDFQWEEAIGLSWGDANGCPDKARSLFAKLYSRPIDALAGKDLRSNLASTRGWIFDQQTSLRDALGRLAVLGMKEGIDTKPLLWLARYIAGEEAADPPKRSEVLNAFDALMLIYPRQGGRASKQEAPPSPVGKIKPENRSKVAKTKTRLAQLHRGLSQRGKINGTDYFKSRPEVLIEGRGQQWYVDITQFPPAARAELMGESEQHLPEASPDC